MLTSIALHEHQPCSEGDRAEEALIQECTLCSSFDEARDHLFLSCAYSREIWRLVFQKLDPFRSALLSWSELLSWIRASSARSPSLLRKIVAQAVVYNIWRQRNNFYHNSQAIPPSTIFRMLDKDIRNIIHARSHRKRFSRLMELWLV